MRSPSGIMSARTRASVVLPVPVGPLRMIFSRALTAASRSGTARAGIVPDLTRSLRLRNRRSCCLRMVITRGLAIGGSTALSRLPSRIVTVTIGLSA